MSTLATPTVDLSPVAYQKPKKPWRWRGGLFAGACSVVGIYHRNNEDSFRFFPGPRSPRFCGVADGVGGGSHGDLASSAVLDHCAAAPPKVMRDPKALSRWLATADTVVRERVASRGDRPGAATLVGAWFYQQHRAYVSHIGDCRLYKLMPGASGYWIEQITLDQTYGNLGLNPPEGGSPDDPAHMIGVGAMGTPPIVDINLQEGEFLLFCSDGLHKFVQPDVLAHILFEEDSLGKTESEICQALVNAAKQAKSHDDITALLLSHRPWLGVYRKYRLAFLSLIFLLALISWFAFR